MRIPISLRTSALAALTMLLGLTVTRAQEYTWIKTSLQTGSRITSIVVKGATIIAGTESRGIFRSTDDGTTWAPVSPGATLKVRAMIDDERGGVIAGTHIGALRSTDEGATWSALDAGLSTKGRGVQALDIFEGLVAAATDDGIYYLRADGEEWTAGGLQGREVTAFTLDGKGGALAATVPNVLFHTPTTAPDAWVQSERPMTAVSAMTRGPLKTGKIFAAISLLYVTFDRGVKWYETTFSTLLIYTLVHDRNERILIGDWGGIYVSSGNGSGWDPLRGLNAPRGVTGIAVGNDDRIYGGTIDGELYISGTTSSVAHHDAASAIPGHALGQSYPNPAHAMATIPFVLPHRSPVALRITDPLGRRVAGMNPGMLDAGPHAIDIDLSSLASGLYCYTLQTDEGAETRLMTVVR